MNETLTLLHVNNKEAEQPGHQPRLISSFVNHYQESIVYKLAICKISII